MNNPTITQADRDAVEALRHEFNRGYGWTYAEAALHFAAQLREERERVAKMDGFQVGEFFGPDNPFNEDALGREIARVWGEHGAHSEVYGMLRAALREAARKEK